MIKLDPGRYVVAVSGGVDSMVLLDMLCRQGNLELIVAHADHGMRPDSPKDSQLVERYAKRHNLIFVATQLKLGVGASEEKARRARYNFLQHCCKTYNARGIVLAHHQDDLIETAIIAIMRGTGWRGLAPFVGTSLLLRPLLNVPKWQLIAYARKHNITWREDSTNANTAYLRNYVRHALVPQLDQKSSVWRNEFLRLIRKQRDIRGKLELALSDFLHNDPTILRHLLIMAPDRLGYELLQQWFRKNTGNSLTRPLAESVLLFAKTARPRKIMHIGAAWQVRTTLRQLIVEPRTP